MIFNHFTPNPRHPLIDIKRYLTSIKYLLQVQEKRLELSWYCYHTDLNRARLPIPPFLRTKLSYTISWKKSTSFFIFFKIFSTASAAKLFLAIASGSKGARTPDLSRVRRTLIPAELCFHVLYCITLLKKCKRKSKIFHIFFRAAPKSIKKLPHPAPIQSLMRQPAFLFHSRYFSSCRETSRISIGFATWAFMPASRHF